MPDCKLLWPGPSLKMQTSEAKITTWRLIPVLSPVEHGGREELLMFWHLRTLFLAVAVVAVGLGIARAFWTPTYPNYRMYLGFYLVVVSTCIVAAIPRAAKFRGGFLGASAFGVSYGISALNAGFGVETDRQAQAFIDHTISGLVFAGLAFLASQLVSMLVWPRRAHPE